MIRIFCSSPLDWTLGCEYLLLAMRQLIDRGVEARLCIAGDGPERERVLFTIHDLGLVEVVSLVSDIEVRERRAQADVIVRHSLDSEAGAAPKKTSARAVIEVTDNGGPTSGFDDRVWVRVPTRHPAALCDALARVAATR